MTVDMVTIPDVPILTTGTYRLMSGEHAFTQEELLAAVDALNDPAIKVPRVRIDGFDASFNPDAHGGEPAFGRVEGMRLSDDGQTITGDLVVPRWLADTIDWAYPARSIEGDLAVKSATGRTHSLVIRAVALLGVDLPGVATLPDLQDLLSANGPAPKGQEVLARMAPSPTIRAGLDTETIRQRFVDEVEGGGINLPEGTTAWSWWPRSVRVEDNGSLTLIVGDDASGRSYSLAVAVSANEVTFGDPVEVVEQYVAASADDTPTPLAVWASRADSRPDTTRKEDSMDVELTLLRKRLGLAEDATEDQITEALASEPAVPDETAIPAAEVEEKITEAVAAARADERQKITASDGGSIRLDSASYEALKASAEKGAEAHKKLEEGERDTFIAAAVGKGKFPPSRVEHYTQRYEQDPEGTRAEIEALQEGVVPVIGVQGSAAAEDDPNALTTTGWFPQLANKES